MKLFSKEIEINEYTFVAPVNNDISFAVVSDFHESDNAKDILSILNTRTFDAILIPGDITTDPYLPNERSLALIKELCKRSLVFYSPGNHEYPLNSRYIDTIKSYGVIWLDNDMTFFKDIVIGGVSSEYDIYFIDKFSKSDRFRLMLCHHPEYYGKCVALGDADLIVSGHAHGGQWRMFGKGVFSPGQGLFPKYTHGIYDNKLIVGRGLANHTWVPRINDPFEIMFVTLKAKKEQ